VKIFSSFRPGDVVRAQVVRLPYLLPSFFVLEEREVFGKTNDEGNGLDLAR
jgi:exosome complex RNA-binding protein Csl4